MEPIGRRGKHACFQLGLQICVCARKAGGFSSGGSRQEQTSFHLSEQSFLIRGGRFSLFKLHSKMLPGQIINW